ncbi:TetR family transcriptional regulator [Brachybacterium sp. AG952]|uniref:TetR/AcrR family transcriptional regulator n=1 Tax=Brachybacterium TaxID=43668 RepID=UPI00026C689F|nr:MULTISPECIES: TetR/AcrR family transcriptional regulator [Brachybacterium]TDP80047.1 TetR family transcriptional regulator [Brachybacterium sp. AG952]
MTSVVTNGSLGAGTGPVPPSAVFSDRAGEESPCRAGGGALEEPLGRVLRNLDTLTESQDGLGAGLEGAPGASADGAARVTVGAGTTIGSGTADGAVAAEGATAAEPSRREMILDAASALFAERGYDGASLRDISRRVGISHPGMLHHFSSKDVLLGAVIDRMEAHAQGMLDSADSIASSPETLIAALGGPWDPRKHAMALLATLSAEIVDPGHPGRFRIARLRLVHEHVLERVFGGLGEQGRLVAGASPKFLARSLFSLLLSLTVREHTVRELQKTSDADPIEDVQEFVRLCCVTDRAPEPRR